MGVTEERIFAVPFVVDNVRFMAASQIDTEYRRKVRRSLNVHDHRPIVLYAAKFTRGKRPDDLLRAAALLKREGILFRLVLIGSGEMEQELRVLATELELDNVDFVGFINQNRIPKYYAASDVFVLPSENETWGLAINEAMCAGLPIVASEEIGCVPDLVHNGVNGGTFRARMSLAWQMPSGRFSWNLIFVAEWVMRAGTLSRVGASQNVATGCELLCKVSGK